MNKKLRELQARKAQSVAAMRAITNKAGAESRDLTETEATEFDTLAAQITQTDAAIDREQMLALAEAQIGVEVPDTARLSVSDNVAADPKL